MKAEILLIYNEILEKYKDKWFTTYEFCGAKSIEDSPNVFIWSHDQTELSYFNKILNIFTSANILKRKREYRILDKKIGRRYYMFYKLEKEVDIKIIESMDFLHKEGYFSKNEINTIKIIKADNGEFSEINKRLNQLEESMKVLQQEINVLSSD